MSTTGRRIRRGWQWGASAMLATTLSVPFAAAASIESAQPDPGLMGVIVQELPGAGSAPEHAVARLGGSVTRQIALIHGFSARIPAAHVDELAAAEGVRAVTPDARVTLMDVATGETTPSLSDGGTAEVADPDQPADQLEADGDAQAAAEEAPALPEPEAEPPLGPMDGHNAVADPGSLYNTADVIGATRFWGAGETGKGVDVAVIDSGVSPVMGLDAPGKVVFGPDLSFESQHDNIRYLDTFGHGTHMAGIIAARDKGAPTTPREGASTHLRGVAPGARIVSVKVADRGGAADVSQVIAGIDWVVQHRNRHGMNIRVLNLSFGTDGVQDYRYDPLTYAVEAAWRKGIVVVVSAGNAGYGSPKLNNPAYDPYVIAVGASDPKGTKRTDDDDVPAWSSTGDGTRNPDLVAPGKSIVSLRVPGSGIDTMAPGGRVGTVRFFRGSGTSQAAAVVSGAAAVLIGHRPWLAPDQVKAMLTHNASRMTTASDKAQGHGVLRIGRLLNARVPRLSRVRQTWPKATGTGSLDAARGTHRLESDGVVLQGEIDIFGNPWNGSLWAGSLWNGSGWSGGVWNGSAWTGVGWSGVGWSGSGWSGSGWSGSGWSGVGWSGVGWSGSGWSGSGWSGSGWSGVGWSGSGWSGSGWSGSGWSGSGWSGSGWSNNQWSGSGWSAAGWGT